MTESEIYKALDGIFSQVFRRRIELKPELTAKDVAGWDSFRFISLIMATEKHFGIKLRSADLDNLSNVGDLVRAIVRLGP